MDDDLREQLVFFNIGLHKANRPVVDAYCALIILRLNNQFCIKKRT